MKTKVSIYLSAALCSVLGGTGCGSHNSPNAGASPTTASPAAKAAAPAPVTPMTPEQLKQARVNETGVVPILEYHGVVPVENAKKYERSIENFRADLQRLYDEGYRPILMRDFLDNHIDVPLGTTPVIFTFDDARESQIRYLPDGTLDPTCALGIMKDFAAKHPDFPVKATFYVLPDVGFGQKGMAAKKMQEILAMGCEIGNHTVTHTALHTLSDENVQKELAGCVEKVLKLAPGAKIDTVALPLGSSPKNPALLASGTFAGQSYANRAVLLVGANPAPSPVSTKYNPMRLPRIQAAEIPWASTDWLNRLKLHPGDRYISDGDPAAVSVPKAQAAKVDQSKLQGATLRLY